MNTAGQVSPRVVRTTPAPNVESSSREKRQSCATCQQRSRSPGLETPHQTASASKENKGWLGGLQENLRDPLKPRDLGRPPSSQGPTMKPTKSSGLGLNIIVRNLASAWYRIKVASRMPLRKSILTLRLPGKSQRLQPSRLETWCDCPEVEVNMNTWARIGSVYDTPEQGIHLVKVALPPMRR